MRPEALLALRGEVKMQCCGAMNAAEELEQYLAVRRVRYNREQPDGAGRALLAFSVDAWRRVSGILSAAGVVSRTLWPKPPHSQRARTDWGRLQQRRAQEACDRAKEIWSSWPMPSEMALAPLRERHARNAMEHVENGAAEWMQSFDNGNVHAFGIGSRTSNEDVQESKQCFRYFFADTWDLSVGGHPANLKRIVEALAALQRGLPFELEMTVSSVVELVPTDPHDMTPGIRPEPT